MMPRNPLTPLGTLALAAIVSTCCAGVATLAVREAAEPALVVHEVGCWSDEGDER